MEISKVKLDRVPNRGQFQLQCTVSSGSSLPVTIFRDMLQMYFIVYKVVHRNKCTHFSSIGGNQ